MSGLASESQWAGTPHESSEPTFMYPRSANGAANYRADAAIAGAEDAVAGSEGAPHLALQLAGTRCLLPLSALRGVLADPPKIVRFPFSPPWLLGVFLFRTELLALVDPLPVLSGHLRIGASQGWSPSLRSPDDVRFATTSADSPTVLMGTGERTLAIRVASVFEVVFVNGGAETSAPARRAELPESIAIRYIAEMWAPDPTIPACPILAVDPLLDDLLGLLAEEGSDG